MSEQVQVVRTLDMIEMEIRVLQDQTQRIVLGHAIETGRRLEEAKAMLEHGQWGDWLKKMGYGQSTAQNMIRIFREYGANQQSFFGGEANSQTFGNLTYSKALKLLALPDQEERERFVAEHDVENMSTRELEKALKERDAALRAAEEAMAQAASAGEARAKMETDVKMARALAESQKENAKKYKKEADRLQAELKELKAKPVEVAVEKPSPEELEKLTAAAVEKARAEDAQQIADLKKKLDLADGDVTAALFHCKAWQEHFNKLSGYLARIANRDPEQGRRMKAAVKARAEEMTK